MRLSTKGRYTTRAIVDLALNYQKGPVFLKDIAKRQEVSQRYLSQLVIPLEGAGLVKGIRGRRGGLILAKPPRQITLGQVIQISEGRISFEECVDNPKVCSRSSRCAIRDVWSETVRTVERVLESITLQDLIDRQAKKETR